MSHNCGPLHELTNLEHHGSTIDPYVNEWESLIITATKPGTEEHAVIRSFDEAVALVP